MRLARKSAIITGGATGLGLAFAQRLANDGASVVIADIRGSQRAADKLVEQGGTAIGIDTDVAAEAQVDAMVRRTVETFGGVDILINNAAIASTLQSKPFEALTVEEWQQILAINTIGAFLCCRSVAPHMRQRKSGRIINLVSPTAMRGAPNMLHYVASKGALIAMTRSLARELGTDGITVNAVAPGYTLNDSNLANTEWLATHRAAAIATRALKRDAYPDDIVGAIAFLAGDDSAFVTGQILVVDGGATYH